jgi:hypothetical protein
MTIRLKAELFIVEMPPNKSLQGTFDPLPIFAAAKIVIASNASELRRYKPNESE